MNASASLFSSWIRARTQSLVGHVTEATERREHLRDTGQHRDERLERARREAVVAGAVAPRAGADDLGRGVRSLPRRARGRPIVVARRAAREHWRSCGRPWRSTLQFALAWATLSYTLSVAPTWRPGAHARIPSEARRNGASSALAIEPDFAEAHKGLSFAYTVNGDWRRSERRIRASDSTSGRRAPELAERGNFELAVGRIEEARATFRQQSGRQPVELDGTRVFLGCERDTRRPRRRARRLRAGPSCSWGLGRSASI